MKSASFLIAALFVVVAYPAIGENAKAALPKAPSTMVASTTSKAEIRQTASPYEQAQMPAEAKIAARRDRHISGSDLSAKRAVNWRNTITASAPQSNIPQLRALSPVPSQHMAP
jgi:hypothetical protein